MESWPPWTFWEGDALCFQVHLLEPDLENSGCPFPKWHRSILASLAVQVDEGVSIERNLAANKAGDLRYTPARVV